MTGRKSNITAWCLLALAAISCVSMAVGVAYARYREDVSGTVELGIRKNAQIYLLAGKDLQSSTPGTAEWEESGNGRMMQFLISNTEPDGPIPEATQTCTLRMAASLEVWDGVSDIAIFLTYTQDEKAELLQATISPIEPDTVLHRQFGDGWLITFADNRGKEISWKLEGGKRSYVSMHLELETAQTIEEGMIQLLLEGQMTGNL